MEGDTQIIETRIKAQIRDYVFRCGNKEEQGLLEAALIDIEVRYNNQYRCSGEPTVMHSLRVGKLLCQFNAGVPTVIAGLLHDLLEDTETTVEYLRQKYGGWYAEITEALSKTNDVEATHRKLLRFGEGDIRCLIIKIFDRLDNMRHLQWLPDQKQKRISRETVDFYLPIAKKICIPPHVTNELKNLTTAFS